MLRVYYEELDGALLPQKVLVRPGIEYGTSKHDVFTPFERFYDDEFHDDLKIITITQAALTRDIFNATTISVDLDQVKKDLYAYSIHPNQLLEADYFLMLMSDIEEVLQMTLHQFFKAEV
ncbi:hypothetical protein NSQ54_10625 [Alkalihalobacillus sp. FSL W8-0930]